MKKKTCVLSLGLVLLFTFVYAKKDKEQKLTDIQKAVEIKIKGFDNLYKVSDSLYRSDQPNKDGFAQIENIGVKSVLNLRQDESDKKEVKKTNLILLQLPLDPLKIDQKDILEALQAIQQAKKPVLVHCKDGAALTGVVVAAYRMVFQGWEEDDAIKEFKMRQFGFDEKDSPNIEEVLKDLDVKKIRKKLGFN